MANIESCKDDIREGIASLIERSGPRSGSEGVRPPDLDYIPLFLDFYERYSGLSYEERGRLAWAMLAYASGEDPDPHLTDELRRFCFPNERNLIDRTTKVHVERKERLKAASMLGVAARKNANHAVTDGNHVVTDGNHNNNNNYNNNNNHNNNNNNNKGGMTIVYGANRRSAAGKPAPVGREKIL